MLDKSLSFSKKLCLKYKVLIKTELKYAMSSSLVSLRKNLSNKTSSDAAGHIISHVPGFTRSFGSFDILLPPLRNPPEVDRTRWQQLATSPQGLFPLQPKPCGASFLADPPIAILLFYYPNWVYWGLWPVNGRQISNTLPRWADTCLSILLPRTSLWGLDT